jgi:hypothetical protein
MQKSSRKAGLSLLIFAVMLLFWYLTQPRVRALHGADIVGLMACGACFGIAFAGLIGQLKLRNE